MAIIRAADLFCGAGGSSTGLQRVADALGARLDLTAINHWPTAVETHAANHPGARHVCENLDGVDARKVTGGKLDLLWASPECTHHSTARGGKPIADQSRSTAWHVLRWAEALRPRWVIVENVPEFQTWGPLGANDRPLKSRKGQIFGTWLQGLRSIGYHVEHRVLNAADYAAATSRRRLYVVARLDGGRARGPISWPTATHAPTGSASLFDELQPWRGAREVIDWSLAGTSIFGRKKPLADNTLRRIAAGARKFWGVELEPFLLNLRGTEVSHIASSAASLDAPVRTVSAGGTHVGVVQPFLVPFYGERAGQNPRTHSLDAPLPTVVTEPKFGIATPFLLGQQSGAEGRPVSQPSPTIATSGAISLIEAFLVAFYSSGSGLEPQSLDRPLPTVTTRDRFGLVQRAHLDITFRMLKPHELSSAMGFPVGYRFAGNSTEQVRQIGNAVEVNQAAALWRHPVEHVLGLDRKAA
jgi:DNA (cytosine-5)-methyltransferase 1